MIRYHIWTTIADVFWWLTCRIWRRSWQPDRVITWWALMHAQAYGCLLELEWKQEPWERPS